MYTRSLIKRMTSEEVKHLRYGSCLALFGSCFISYMYYREWQRREFLRSHAHYRMSFLEQNATPWHHMYLSWYRMPIEEYESYHRFKNYYLLGQVDHSKEILIPKKHKVNGLWMDGFDVLNPLYCYESGRISFSNLFKGDKNITTLEKAAVIINRGWIPYDLKDKSTRPWEVNDTRLVKIKGTFMPGKDIHDYKYPNNPNTNEWYNIALEDIARFWDLPNATECKYYYFQAVDVENVRGTKDEIHGSVAPYPLPPSIDNLFMESYGFRMSPETTRWLFRGFAGLAAFSGAIGFLSL